jgi:hypothetical protein
MGKLEIMPHFNPTEYAIHIFGGVKNLAAAIGRHPSAISKWKHYTGLYRREGTIPDDIKIRILEIAKRKKLDINAKDLILGRRVIR